MHGLHQQYGPIVRLSPDEISLADIKSAKTIYRVGGPYLKTPFYKAFTGTETYGNLFTILDKNVHNHNRKLQSHHFSEKWVKNMEPFIIANVQRAVGRMVEDVERKGWTDVLKWITFMATDIIGEASFGDSFRMLETGNVRIMVRYVPSDRAEVLHRKISTLTISRWSPLEASSAPNFTALSSSYPIFPSDLRNKSEAQSSACKTTPHNLWIATSANGTRIRRTSSRRS